MMHTSATLNLRRYPRTRSSPTHERDQAPGRAHGRTSPVLAPLYFSAYLRLSVFVRYPCRLTRWLIRPCRSPVHVRMVFPPTPTFVGGLTGAPGPPHSVEAAKPCVPGSPRSSFVWSWSEPRSWTARPWPFSPRGRTPGEPCGRSPSMLRSRVYSRDNSSQKPSLSVLPSHFWSPIRPTTTLRRKSFWKLCRV